MKFPEEGDLVRAALAWLKLNFSRGVWWRNNVGAFAGEYKGRKRFVRFGVKGLSDIQGVNPDPFGCGFPYFIECKTANGKQSTAQKAFQERVERAGAKYILIRSIEDLETALS